MHEKIKAAAKLIAEANKVGALTGAGVSAESGIPDFRSASGLWSRYNPMEYGTIGAFQRDPAKVWQMLTELVGIVDAMPNKGHKAMAELENMGLLSGIITQNIDSLHQKAGSLHVIDFHGNLETFSCLECGHRDTLIEITKHPLPPVCPSCSALLKPDIVFFDEQIPSQALQGAEALLHDTDVLIVAGTSCQVPPAAYFPEIVLQRGGKILEINLEPVLQHKAHISLQGKYAETMTNLVRAIKEGF